VVDSEDMANGDHRDAVVVEDLDALGIVETIATLGKGADLAGFELNGAPNFTTGCSVPGFGDAKQMDAVLDTARQKIAAGAQYLVVSPIFDVVQATPFLEQVKKLGAPVIATIFLIKSVGVARYMALNDPSAHISEALIKRIRKAADRETECLKLAGETIAQLKGVVAGVKIETLGWEHRLPAILDYAGI
jgi:5,10-methylenetetrahydrofolate reductase